MSTTDPFDAAGEEAARIELPIFIRLTDKGDSVTGVVVGDPLKRVKHWDGKSPRGLCEGDTESCDGCAAGLETRTSWMVNFWDTVADKMRILDMVPKVVTGVVALKADHDIRASVLCVTRTGTSYDTAYTVVYKGPLPAGLAPTLILPENRHDLATAGERE